MEKMNIRLLWSDRKRILGMPLSFTRYSLSEDRLFCVSGFLNIRDEEVLLYRVRDISMRRTLFQRLFGVGTITVLSSDKSMPTMVLQNVKHPLEVKELIHRNVEEMKIRRRVRLREIDGVSDGHDCHHGMHDEDDDFDGDF